MSNCYADHNVRCPADARAPPTELYIVREFG
jgi:hypothetical protein